MEKKNRNETFRSAGAERRYRNKRREMEKKKRHQPTGRVVWVEV